MDPDIARDLELRLIGDETYRLRVMGIKVDTTAPMTIEDVAWGRFAHQIRYGPWDRCVQRRADERERQAFHQRSLEAIFGKGPWMLNICRSNWETFRNGHPDPERLRRELCD